MLERTLLLFMLQAVGVYSNRLPAANLTATDAYPVLGGYVVPVNGSITLHCDAPVPPYRGNTFLRWNIALGSYSRNETTAEFIAFEFSNKFTHVQTDVSNPDMLRIHNLQISENKSTVQCYVSNEDNAESEVITICVEDIPDCVENLNTSSNDTSYIVSWKSYNGLLPVMYKISIWSTSNKVVMSKSTSPNIQFDSNVNYLQSNTTYFVLVTTCNSAGCSQDCGNASIHTGPGDLHKQNVDTNSTQVDSTSTSLSGGILIFIITPVAVAVFIVILTVVVLLSWCVVCSHRRSNQSGVYQTSAAQLNYHVHMSKRGLQETDNVNHTSIDVTGVVMEENPAYRTVPIRMAMIGKSGELEELRTDRNRSDVLVSTKEEVQRNPAY